MKAFIVLLLFAATSFAQIGGGIQQPPSDALFVGPLSVAKGGTGASDAASARANLGISSAGTNAAGAFQPSSSVLTNLANNNGSSLTNFPSIVLQTNVATTTITTFSAPNISNNVTLANVSTNTLLANTTYRVYIYSAAYADGTNGWQIRNNVSPSPNTSISLAPTRALNGGNWAMGGAITDVNSTVSLATSAGQLYIYANTYIFRHTSNVTLNVQFAQNVSGAVFSTVSGTIVIEPIAW